MENNGSRPRKPELKAAALQAEIDRRLQAAGLAECRSTPPQAVRPSIAFGRNWHADIEGARSGAEYERAVRIVRDVGAEFDCLDFPALKRGR